MRGVTHLEHSWTDKHIWKKQHAQIVSRRRAPGISKKGGGVGGEECAE